MSQENVEITRRMTEAFNAGGSDALGRYFHSEIEWHEDPTFPEAGVYRGFDEASRYTKQFLSEFSDIRYEAAQRTDAGEHVIANMRVTGSGKASEPSSTFRPGGLSRYAYFNRDAAIDAVGPSE